MSWTARALVAVVLTVACATLPLVLDQCAASCAAHSPATSPSSPSCHHAASTRVRLGSVPAPCGHDHSGPVTTLTAAPSPIARPLISAPAVSADAKVVTDLNRRGIDVSDPISTRASTRHAVVLPLRL
jgi:hypothetical protein